MASSDSKQGSAPLLPASKRVYADAHGTGELCLRQQDKPSKRCDVITGLESEKFPTFLGGNSLRTDSPTMNGRCSRALSSAILATSAWVCSMTD